MLADVFLNILYSFGWALAQGIIFYLQNTPTEQFSPKTFLKTLVIGLLVGAAMFEMKLNYDQALGLILQPLIIAYVDKIVNAIMDWLGWGPAPKQPGSGDNVPL